MTIILPSEFASLLTPLAPKAPLAVAVSGGADSMALALLLREYTSDLVALTVDHGLRAESSQEAAQVHAWLTARNIRQVTLRWQHEGISSNIQEQAREARYRLMSEYCLAHAIPTLLTAHHRDDQVETLLLRLKRGSHIEGLAAMQACSERQGLMLLRPLLGVPKARLIATLLAQNQEWIEDPSNRAMDYDRSRLRQQLATLPESEEITRRLAYTAQRLGALREERAEETRAFLNAYSTRTPGTLAQCALKPLQSVNQDLALRVLSALLRQVSGAAHPVRFEQLERLLASMLAPAPRQRSLDGCLICVKNEILEIRPERLK